MMVVALSQMGAGWQAFLFVLAVLCFFVAALFQDRIKQVQMMALGLLFFVFVFAWNALAAT